MWVFFYQFVDQCGHSVVLALYRFFLVFVLLTFLAHGSSSSCGTDAGEVIVLLLAGSAVTARLRIARPVGVGHRFVQ